MKRQERVVEKFSPRRHQCVGDGKVREKKGDEKVREKKGDGKVRERETRVRMEVERNRGRWISPLFGLLSPLTIHQLLKFTVLNLFIHLAFGQQHRHHSQTRNLLCSLLEKVLCSLPVHTIEYFTLALERIVERKKYSHCILSIVSSFSFEIGDEEKSVFAILLHPIHSHIQ